MPKTSNPSKADSGTTSKRQKVLAYLLKRKALASSSAIPASDVHTNAGGAAVCKAMVDTGHLGVSVDEKKGKSFYLTPAGKKAIEK